MKERQLQKKRNSQFTSAALKEMNAKKLAEQKQSEEEILDQVMSKEDALVEVVDDLWDKYDDDYNGYLDYDEARVFMQDILK